MKELKGARIRKVFILCILIIVAIGVIYHLFFMGQETIEMGKEQMANQEKSDEPGPGGPQQGPSTPIKAFAVAQFDFKDYLNALGTVKGGLEFKLSFEIPGIVESVNYKEGEDYAQGALLVSLRQNDILLRLRRSEARHKKAMTSTNIYKQKLEEHQKLFDIGAIPQSTLDKARLEHQGAMYEKEETALQVRADEVILEKSNMYAPSDGMIGELNVEVGEAVTSNTLIGTHVLTDYVKAEFGVIERDVTRIKPRQPAFVYVDAYPDKVFNGEVDQISPIVTGTSRTASAEIKIANEEGFLLPGMFARIKILLFEKNNAIVIPTEAIIQVDGKSAVYIVDEEQNKVQMREVLVEYSQSDYTVINDGLRKDELIAISSLDKLEPGASVEVLERQEI